VSVQRETYRTLFRGDCLVGTNVRARAAIATGILVDHGFLVYKLDGVQRASLDAVSTSRTRFLVD
jgi:hypothetical protein